MNKLLLLLLTAASTSSFAWDCVFTYQDGIKHPVFGPALKHQEYVGNLGRAFAKKKDHDTYLNWEVRDGYLYGRVYNVTYNLVEEGYFSLCKHRGLDYLVIEGEDEDSDDDDTAIGFKVRGSGFLGLRYEGISIALKPYSLRQHGTLRYKLKNSQIGSRVSEPRPLP